ncbi:MAG: DUF4760 domain-containing protein [Terriglobia bacterium]
MPQHLDHHDAELLLRLYDLRREEKLRQAREWYLQEFQADTRENLMKQFPPGTKENAYYRMVVTYWDMAASLLNHGLINEDLFFENNSELWAIWSRIEPLLAEIRAASKNPLVYGNLEAAGKKYEAWMEKRAPGALAVRREFLQQRVLGSGKK